MATYKIEPISGDKYRLELINGVGPFNGIRTIRFEEIPSMVHTLEYLGYTAEKIEWHCVEK